MRTQRIAVAKDAYLQGGGTRRVEGDSRRLIEG